MIRAFIVCLVVFATITSSTAIAQEPTSTTSSSRIDEALEARLFDLDTSVGDVPGLVSCFDYYEFGSTPVSAESELSEVAQGAMINFKASITNDNPYPLVDADVIAKVFKRGGEEKDPNGPEVVDFFPVIEGVTLKANETREFEIAWDVPQSATEGRYFLTTYVVSNDRFNMLGLSFTDDIIGPAFDFSVVGNNRKQSVAFDKSSVTINGEPYFFAAYPPRINGPRAEIAATIQNPSRDEVRTSLVWELYTWDGVNPRNLIDSKRESVLLGSGETQALSFTTDDTAHPVYYLSVRAETPGHAASVLGIRFTRPENAEPRINFAGVSAYPPVEGTAAFLCAHSVGTGPVDDVRLSLTVEGRNSDLFSTLFGQKSYTQEYAGVIPGDIRAMTLPVPSIGTSFDVVSRLYHKDVLIDEVRQTFRCEDLDAPCPMDGTTLLLRISLVLLGFIIVGTLIYFRPRKTLV